MFRSLNQKDAVLSCAEEVVVWDSFDGLCCFFSWSLSFFLPTLGVVGHFLLIYGFILVIMS